MFLFACLFFGLLSVEMSMSWSQGSKSWFENIKYKPRPFSTHLYAKLLLLSQEGHKLKAFLGYKESKSNLGNFVK